MHVTNVSAFDSRIHLAWGDVAVSDTVLPSVVRVHVHLKRSKCDQFGKGVDIFLGCTYSEACPVLEILRYVGVRGPASGPFFLFENGAPLTKAVFISRVRAALITLGLNCQNYAGHSFWIGAATTVAQAGLEDSVIQSLGRWSSNACLRYIRTPRDQLANYSRTLARTHRGVTGHCEGAGEMSRDRQLIVTIVCLFVYSPHVQCPPPWCCATALFVHDCNLLFYGT